MKGSPIELWAGAECTINRVGDHWRDQAVLTGSRERDDDLDRLAALGARRVRLPVLWEHVQPDPARAPDFTWPDRAMAKLRALGMQAIVGLLHHGSGPAHTHLLDDAFPQLFAGYAARVAARYPEQRWWTPINEPVTTARFSCLYGVWYPHRQDDASFVRALLNQMRATVLAMRVIRAVNPAAELVQTDDLGFTRCTPGLVDQAAFDNERRWLGFDLLAGRVDESHPLWPWLIAVGASASELRQFVDEPCPPAIIGINAYVTSERFLDERLALHPEHRHGGNGRQRYVDIETARAHGDVLGGFAGRLREAHDRYGLPLAITEVHLGCTREEQMRWFHQAWQAAVLARAQGIDVRAVTAWAVFGTVDWNSLLAQDTGHYEPGLWDARTSPPRQTALGRLVATLASGVGPLHPVLESPGWWQRDLRLSVPPHGTLAALPMKGAPLLILGMHALGRAFARLCHMRGLACEVLPNDSPDVARAMSQHAPWALIDATLGERDASQRRALAAACRAAGIGLVTFTFGETPEDERAALVVRTSALFGPWDDENFVTRGLALLRAGREWTARADQVIRPTYLPDLVQASLDLLIDGERGVWTLTNGDAVSWVEFARRVARSADAEGGLIRAAGNVQDFELPAAAGPRLLPTLDDALARYHHDRPGLPTTRYTVAQG